MAPCSATQNPDPTSVSVVQMLLELQQIWHCDCCPAEPVYQQVGLRVKNTDFCCFFPLTWCYYVVACLTTKAEPLWGEKASWCGSFCLLNRNTGPLGDVSSADFIFWDLLRVASELRAERISLAFIQHHLPLVQNENWKLLLPGWNLNSAQPKRFHRSQLHASTESQRWKFLIK